MLRFFTVCLMVCCLFLWNIVQADQENNTSSPAVESVSEKPNVGLGRFGESGAVDPDEVVFSEAETLLWVTDHLSAIKRPTRLHYRFKKSGTYEDGFVDSIYLDILKINEDGSKDTALEFFSGDRKQPTTYENLVQVTGNPVIGIFLQGDVNEMQRLTKGSWRYFQKKIKLHLAEEATVESIDIDFEGKKVSGKKITFFPYAKDVRRRQFEQFADKQYEFFLSDSIPGFLYQIHTVIPNIAGKNLPPIIEDILTLQSVNKR